MGTCALLNSVCLVWAMVCAFCLVLILLDPATVSAQGTLGYSFESGLQGFGPNPALGITVTQDTIGATEGTQSMKVSLLAGATFVGAITANLDPNDASAPGGPPTFQVGNPPGFDHIIIDLTLEEPQPFPGTFVSLGIFMFGDSQDGQFEGQGAQFFDNEIRTIGDLPAGTHQIVFTLDSGIHPLTFESASFNEIFGPPSSDPNDANDLILTSFEIYVNKAGSHAWEGYIDNIRFADAIPGDFNRDLVVDGIDFLFWQRGETPEGGSQAELAIWEANYFTDAIPGDFDSDLVVDGLDFLDWQRGETPEGGSQDELAIWEANYGSVVPLAAEIATVPEPTAVGLACAAMLALLSVRRMTSWTNMQSH
jgi:hypothetical protein